MSETILLVDDDDAFRESVRDFLLIEGYKVIEVNDGKDAIPIVEAKNIDLIITDILMPEIEGNQLAIKVKKIRPELNIIGMTGGGRLVSADMVLKVTSPLIFETILRKPFSSDELIMAVKTALK